MFGFGRKNEIVAAATGKQIPLHDLNDGVFSKGTVGDGVAIKMEDDIVCSPCDGTLAMVFRTGHAFGVRRKDGFEIMVHIGIDTVNLKGRGFHLLVNQGTAVKSGQPIIKVDRKLLEENGYKPYAIMIVTNSADRLYRKNSIKDVVRGKTSIITIGG